MIDALLTIGVANIAAVLAIAVIGLPHGAFDGAIALHMGFAKRPMGFVLFIAAYTALAAAVVAVWMVLPAFSLLVFMAISMVHFGLGDARARHGVLRWSQAVAHGGVVVVGISFLHPIETDRIFAFLVGDDTALVWTGLRVLAVVTVAALIHVASAVVRGRLDGSKSAGFGGLLEIGLLAIIFAFTPPLVGFAVYFCCVHSARHMRHIWQDLRQNLPLRRLQGQAAAFTVASWIAGAGALWVSSQAVEWEGAIMQVVFIGLAALTVPHMLLVDGMFRRHHGGSN